MKQKEKDKTIKVIIPEKFDNKVRYLCSEINKVEWSGILFYKEVKSIRNPESLKLILQDIYLMDIGSSAYTEFKHSGEYIDYMLKNNLESFNQGLIHSHNNMSVFFSNTDTDELKENSRNYNYYLSVITNNAGQYTAKVCQYVTNKKVVPLYAYDGKGVKYKKREEEFEFSNYDIYDCDIEVKNRKIIKYDNLSNRIKQLRKNSASSKHHIKNSPNSYSNSYLEFQDMSYSPYNKEYDNFYFKKKTSNLKTPNLETPSLKIPSVNNEIDISLEFKMVENILFQILKDLTNINIPDDFTKFVRINQVKISKISPTKLLSRIHEDLAEKADDLVTLYSFYDFAIDILEDYNIGNLNYVTEKLRTI